LAREKWKKCKACGTITDIDEEKCPTRGLDNNPGHELEVVELDFNEVEELRRDRRIYTKEAFKHY